MIEPRFCLQFSYQNEDAVLTEGLFYSVLPEVEGMHIGYIGPYLHANKKKKVQPQSISDTTFPIMRPVQEPQHWKHLLWLCAVLSEKRT